MIFVEARVVEFANWSLQIKGDRPHQEDRFIELQPGSLKSNKDLALFAVFDGQYVPQSFEPIHVLTVCSVQVQLCPII